MKNKPRRRKEEEAKYARGVDIYWQPKTWADRPQSLEWIKGTLRRAVRSFDGEPVLLLLDNLDSQTHVSVRKAAAGLNVFCFFGPPSMTDVWQPVDARVGGMVKRRVNADVATTYAEWFKKNKAEAEKGKKVFNLNAVIAVIQLFNGPFGFAYAVRLN